MLTHYLTGEQVDGYLRHLVSVFRERPELRDLWCVLGTSGDVLARRIGGLDQARSLGLDPLIVRLDYDRTANELICQDGMSALREAVTGKSVVLLDSSVHSGRTMLRAYRELVEKGAASVFSYSLVLKQGATMVPNRFGVMIGDHDRALFLLDAVPNNESFESGCIRRLSEADLAREYIRTGIPAYDRHTWSDHWYDCAVDARRSTYVCDDHGTIAGVLDFVVEHGQLRIDLVAVDKAMQGRGVAGGLMRWPETQGRFRGCARITLWADERSANMYRHLQYEDVPGVEPMILDATVYRFMHKPLLYHLPLNGCD